MTDDRNSNEKISDDGISEARADIRRRVEEFRETQARFQRQREDYYEAVIEKVRSTDWNEFVTPSTEKTASRR